MLCNHSYFSMNVLFHFLHSFLHSVFLSMIIHSYNHLNLWFHVFLLFWEILNHYLLKYCFYQIVSLYTSETLNTHIFCIMSDMLLFSFLCFPSVSLNDLVQTFSTDLSSCSHLLLHLVHI